MSESDYKKKRIVFLLDIDGRLYGSKVVNGKFVLPKTAVHYDCAYFPEKEINLYQGNFSKKSYEDDPDLIHLDRKCERCGKELATS